MIAEATSAEARADEAARAAQLVFVRTVRCAAEVVDWEAAEALDASRFNMAQAQVQASQDEQRLQYLFLYPMEFAAEDGTVAVRVELQIVAGFLVDEDQGRLDGDVTEAFGRRFAAPILHPYFREGLSSMLTRIGCAPLLAGLLKVEEMDEWVRQEDPEEEPIETS